MFGLRLDADAVRALHVAAHDCPHDAAEEHEASGVANEGIGLIGGAMEELELLGHLVVDFEDRGDTEQHQEPEVDHRVHEAGTGITQECLHVDTGAEVLEAPLGVLGGGAALRRCRRVPSSSSGS